MISVTLPYAYPKLLEVLQASHTLTRNPQTVVQNITLDLSHGRGVACWHLTYGGIYLVDSTSLLLFKLATGQNYPTLLVVQLVPS